MQDILNLAKERGGEWDDMIFASATGRSPDAPDACYLVPGLADLYVSGRVSKEWFRSIFGPQFGATGLRKVVSTAMHCQCHEFGVRPETVDFHLDHPYPHNRGQGSGGSGLGGSTYNNESRKRLVRLQLSLVRWPVEPGLKPWSSPRRPWTKGRGRASWHCASCRCCSRRTVEEVKAKEKRRNAVAPAGGKNVDNDPSASQKRRRKRVQS